VEEEEGGLKKECLVLDRDGLKGVTEVVKGGFGRKMEVTLLE
jgi:hypothetical protein